MLIVITMCKNTAVVCNKLASRHVRVGLASPSDVPHCEPVTYVKVLLVCRVLIIYDFVRNSCFIFRFFAQGGLKLVSSLGHVYVAFFYCEIDGTSLCLQCNMTVHVGGKRTHGRYLLLRQRVEVCVPILNRFSLLVL